MPLDTPHSSPKLDSWESFFAALPFVRTDQKSGKRQFWNRQARQQLDATAPCKAGQHDGLERGNAWAEQTVAALRHSDKRGVLLRILREMEFESAEAVGFISELEDQLALTSNSSQG